MEQLGINWGLLVAQLLNVGLVVWLLSSLLFKPVLNMLNERSKRIEESLSAADRAKAEVAGAERERDAEVARARQEAAQIVAAATERAKAQESEMLVLARQEAEKIRSEAREQAVQERDRLLSEAKDQIADLVTMTASKVLKAELAAKGHDALIKDSLSALGRN